MFSNSGLIGLVLGVFFVMLAQLLWDALDSLGSKFAFKATVTVLLFALFTLMAWWVGE